MQWETVIGLEIHAQLATRSKIFSGSATTYGAPPNTQADAIDLGLPGVLPVLNAEAVRMAVCLGLAIQADIAPRCVFARKNYFYPDLPKGYQISQYEQPIVSNGRLEIEWDEGQRKTICITRAHLEEDAGKSLHEDFHGLTGIDLNRAGTPLLEIVSEPDLRSAREAIAYMKQLHQLVRYLGISDGNMQEGSFRCDANVSVRPSGQTRFGTRTEIKNLNSFRFVEQAIDFEVERQISVLESGGSIIQETRLFDPARGETRSMRGKEEAHDYRYFPDPDLLPVVLDAAFIEAVRERLPELPDIRRQRFISEHGLSPADATQLTAQRAWADYYETVIQSLDARAAKLIANWMLGELAALLNRCDLEISASPISSEQLAGLLRRLQDGTLSGNLAKEVFEALSHSDDDADSIIEQRGLQQVSDTAAIEQALDAILAAHPEQVEQYRAGKTKVKGFFVGQVMKAFKGKANPQTINALLDRKLSP